MKACRLVEYGKPRLEVQDVLEPRSPKGEEVLLRSVGGMCHTDVHFALGWWKDAVVLPLPYTMGHEIGGWVEEAGEAAVAIGYEKGTPLLGSGG